MSTEESEKGQSLKKFIRAAQQGNLDELKELYETEVENVNTGNAHGESALHFAAAFGHDSCVDWLLANGAVVDRRSAGGATPLHMAATQGHLNVLKQLVAANADVQAKTARGATALHISARDGRLEVVKWLYSLGCDVLAKTNEGKTPLQYAKEQESREVVAFLEEVSQSESLPQDEGAQAQEEEEGEEEEVEPPKVVAEVTTSKVEAKPDKGKAKPKAAKAEKPGKSPKAPTGLLRSKPLTRLSIAEGSPAGNALRNASNALAHSRQSIIPVEGMQQYSQNSGNFFLGGSYFCPPFEFQGLLRVYEPGTSMFLPWPQRYCVLSQNVLFVFRFWDMKDLVTSVCLEGTLVESGATRTGTMHSFVVCKMRPQMEGGGPIFEEFFATDTYFETESWIQALRGCQRSNIRVALKKMEEELSAFDADDAMNEIESMENAYSSIKNQLVALSTDRKPLEEELRTMRIEFEAESSSAEIPDIVKECERSTAMHKMKIVRLQQKLHESHSKTKLLMKKMEEAASVSEQALTALHEQQVQQQQMQMQQMQMQQMMDPNAMYAAQMGGMGGR